MGWNKESDRFYDTLQAFDREIIITRAHLSKEEGKSTNIWPMTLSADWLFRNLRYVKFNSKYPENQPILAKNKTWCLTAI